jgi:hypothetical protein
MVAITTRNPPPDFIASLECVCELHLNQGPYLCPVFCFILIEWSGRASGSGEGEEE